MWVDNSKSSDERYAELQITFWLIEMSPEQSKDGDRLTSTARDTSRKQILKTKNEMKIDSFL
jgi:hypothetical protein